MYRLPLIIIRLTSCSPSVSYTTFHLLCLQVADIEEVVQQNPGASPEEFASVLWRTQTKWPRPGQLLVEVNGETDSKGIWVPKHLVSIKYTRPRLKLTL